MFVMSETYRIIIRGETNIKVPRDLNSTPSSKSYTAFKCEITILPFLAESRNNALFATFAIYFHLSQAQHGRLGIWSHLFVGVHTGNDFHLQGMAMLHDLSRFS